MFGPRVGISMTSGQIGEAKRTTRTKLRQVIEQDAKSTVAAGDLHSIVVKQDGSVWVTGQNNKGQLRDGTRDGRYSFLEAIPSGAVHVAAGGYHTMVVKEDGSVRATGCNQFDQLGDGGIEQTQ